MDAYLLINSLRNLWRNKLHSLISLASLSLGLAVFSFAFLYVKQEFSYDRSWPAAERIHRLVVDKHSLPGVQDSQLDIVEARYLPELTRDFSNEIEALTRLYHTSVKTADTEGDAVSLVIQRKLFFLTVVDPSFANIFRLEVASGSIESVLQGPGFIAVEEQVAARYPDGPLKVGSRITLKSADLRATTETAGVEYEVGAIFRMPKTTTQSFGMITLMHDYSLSLFSTTTNRNAWWNDAAQVWLTLKPAARLGSINTRMSDFVDHAAAAYSKNLKAGDRVSNHMSMWLQPIVDIHFHPLASVAGINNGDISRVLTIAVIGVLVLLAGCTNSISLGLAMVLERRRVIGIHKVVGALQRDIMLQYLGESVLLALLALIPALVLIEWLTPVITNLLRTYQRVEISPQDFAMLVAIALSVGLASGGYPALVLASVKPQAVLKSAANGKQGGTNRLRIALVGFQFCFAVLLMISTLALYLQLSVVRHQPLGYNPQNLVGMTVRSQDSDKSAALAERLRALPGVVEVAAGASPGTGSLPPIPGIPFIRRGAELIEAGLKQSRTSAEFFPTVQIPLLAGRLLERARDQRDSSTHLFPDQAPGGAVEERALLNRAAVQALGYHDSQEAVDSYVARRSTGKGGSIREEPYKVVGVVEDSMYGSLRSRPVPEIYTLYPANSPVTSVLIKYEDAAESTLDNELKRVSREIFSSYTPTVQFVEPLLANAFAAEQSEGRLLLCCVGLALFLSCIGLYGLVSFTLQRGVKEVGVRKVMGASVLSLVALYLWRYAKPVLTATVIASPVAVYFVLQWLQQFPYQLAKWWLLPLCVTAGAAVLIIALFTVARIVMRAASTKPVQSLRYE